MASSKKKLQPSDFNFEDFLSGGPESGMQTAVRAMLEPSEKPVKEVPDINLIPGVNLNGSQTQNQVLPFPSPLESSPKNSNSESVKATVTLTPSINLIPDINLLPASNVSPGVNVPLLESPQRRSFPVRQMKLAQDAHSRAEQGVYQKLWETAKPHDDVSRLIMIGFGEMGRLVGLSESNARINTRMLIAKLAIEEHSGYNCERGTGRTYRIFTYQEILNRRKQAGLTRYQRRTLAVVFVDEKDQPIDLLATKPGINLTAGGGPKLDGGAGLKLRPEAGPNLADKPGPNLEPLIREHFREEQRRRTTTTTVRTMLQENLPTFDDAAVDQLWSDCTRQVPDISAEEVAVLFRRKLPVPRGIENQNGFLLRAVARSCTTAAIGALRQGRELPKDQPISIATDELEGLLNDPNTPAEMRKFIEHRLRAEA